MFVDTGFTKGSLDSCLRQLAKEYRKLNGTAVPAEIVLIGGAAVLLNYGFRNTTYDVDAIVQATSSMKDAVNRVGDALGLPYDWLNSDFIHTKSYSPRLLQYSMYYKTYSNVLQIRMITGEYLVAMKLMSGRPYKNDISDIIGVLYEEEQNGSPIDFEKINKAVLDLYDGWENMPEASQRLIKEILKSDDLKRLYDKHRDLEKETRIDLLEFDRKYPKALNAENMNDVIKMLKGRKSRED